MWFDYKKAFDSVPHDWILKSLELARVPPKIVEAVRNLMKVWATKLHLGEVVTEIIKYVTGFLQGDCLALVIFILCANPLSFLLRRGPGYKAGPPKERNTKITHLFFVDDLKTYAQDLQDAKFQLDTVTTFTRDIGMEFGVDKCAYIYIERGKKKTLGQSMSIQGTELQELEHGEQYKYLGQEESVGYNAELNKDRVLKEYFKRVRKIWGSELYGNNKVIAHNIFAIPVITPTFGILNWTKEELEQIDIKTRKLLTLSGSFHRNSDIDRLYSERAKGGRGLNSLVDNYIARTVSITQHLKEQSPSNVFLAAVLKHEDSRLVRVSNELTACFGIDVNEADSPKHLSLQIKKKMKDNHLNAWIAKPQHGYLFRTRSSVKNTNETHTNAWMKKSSFSSHVEGYICAIQEEELQTNALKAKRTPENDVNPLCRLCKGSKETIQHVVASCPRLSASMYLPFRHNKVANIVYQKILQNSNKEERHPIQDVYVDDNIEVWWDKKVETLTPCPHNKPDIVLWKKGEKKCHVIDICVGLDVNIDKNISMKNDHYLPLTMELKRLYKDYSFTINPIVIGATGLVTSHVSKMFEDLDLDDIEQMVLKVQRSALIGTLKIVKSVLKI